MIAATLVALAIAPWTPPLMFSPLPGWHTGSSGTTRSAYSGHRTAIIPLESSAWIAQHVTYRDVATADPPNRTLQHLPGTAVLVWAVIISPAQRGQRPVRLSVASAKHFACCEAADVAGGEWELNGAGPGRSYSVIVRIYFGSRPTPEMRAEAQRALNRLRLPAGR